MGRPTKYTSPSSVAGTSQTSHDTNAANVGATGFGCVLLGWAAESLLRQRRQLLQAAVRQPWLMASSELSLSPDSTVHEPEHSSRGGQATSKHETVENLSASSARVALELATMPRVASLRWPSRHNTLSVAERSSCDSVLNLSVKPFEQKTPSDATDISHSQSRDYSHSPGSNFSAVFFFPVFVDVLPIFCKLYVLMNIFN